MKTIVLMLFFALIALEIQCQTQGRVKVMTVGTFHFNFPNLDVQKTDESDKIDVLEQKYQIEIESIVSKLAKFKPTIIVIERTPREQKKMDSLLKNYIEARHTLQRNEEQQIGFRLAKRLNIHRLYCVDEWGNFTSALAKIIDGSADSAKIMKFEGYYEHNADSTKRYIAPSVFKSKGITEQLRQMNQPSAIKKSLGSYLIGIFKYEDNPNDFTGVDFETGRWFSRNLKILRNIQRIRTKESDRILVLYGAGHLNLLNYFFECSPEYELVNPLKYLQ